MKNTEEKGITLITLVITILILIVIASIVATSGMSTIEYAEFSQFRDELQIMQTKINEISEKKETEIGKQLNQEQKKIFLITEIEKILFNNQTEEEKQKIKNGFRYCSADYINKELNLESINRDYIINVEYRYVINYQGFEYEGKTYYMIDQIENNIYNVKYNNKNPKEGDFEVNYTKENNRWKIEVSNISYAGYINNWEIKYRLNGETDWNIANGKSFYVTKQGNYYVQVSYGNDINLGSKLVSIIDETNINE